MNPKHWKEFDTPAVIRRRAGVAKVQRAQLLDPEFKYTPAAQTDVLKTFKRFGWVPPTEVKLREQWIAENN